MVSNNVNITIDCIISAGIVVVNNLTESETFV